MKKNDEFIFAYGTLRKGFKLKANKFFMDNTAFIGKGTFIGKLFEVDKYPAVIASNDPSDKVTGEVYKITGDLNKFFEIMDEYESDSYERVKTTISLLDGSKHNCWFYLYIDNTDNLELIKTGDYLDYVNSNKEKFKDIA